MKLYHCPPTRSNRVLWMLEELDLPCERVALSLRSREHKTDEHLARHPLGLVPVLEDDGQTIVESAAIVVYLADKAGKLAPPVGSPLRGKLYQWMVYVPANVDDVLETYMTQTRWLPADKRDPKVAEAARETFALHAHHLTGLLGKHPYLLGDEFSAADVILGYALQWASSMGLLESFPVLGAYLERLRARPAFQKVWPKA